MALLGWVDLDSDLGPRSVESTVEICVFSLTFKFELWPCDIGICWNTYDGLMTLWIFYTCNNPVKLTWWNNSFKMSMFILSHLCKSNILNKRSSSNLLIKSKPELDKVYIKKNICKCVTIQTVCFQIWKLTHGYHICCANLMTRSVSNVIATMILKEIDIEMRK
jgi:hypothetical protein